MMLGGDFLHFSLSGKSLVKQRPLGKYVPERTSQRVEGGKRKGHLLYFPFQWDASL
jgi:hypothetical protein